MPGHEQYTNRFFQKVNYLGTLSSEEEATLRSFAATSQHIDAQTDLIRQGDVYQGGYILHAGWAVRAITLRDGRRQILNFVLPGDVVGLNAPFSAAAQYSVTTLQAAKVTAITLAQFTDIFHAHPRLGTFLFWQLAQEETIISEHLVNVGRRNAYTRVGHLLAELYWRLDTVGLVHDSTYEAPVSQSMFADALGLSFVHVNRTLRRLRQAGLVQVSGSRITIRDLPALERAVDFEHAYLHVMATPAWLRRYRTRER